jgi:hypothetical protein
LKRRAIAAQSSFDRGPLQRNRSTSLDAPTWLWTSIVELLADHERAYLEHCRKHALDDDH